MCGRYTDTKRDKQFLVRMGVGASEVEQLEFTPRYNVAPTQEAWVVACAQGAAPALKRARWGLVPSWAQDEKIGSRLINARCETISMKAAFRDGYRKRRCLVCADGFFEWKRIEGRGGRAGTVKQPYYIRMKGGEPFVMAGLWAEWRAQDGRCVPTFCVVTVAPNALVAGIHDRMPLILSEEGARKWVDPAASPAELDLLLKPYAAEGMECYPVGSLVSSPANDHSGCIERADPPLELVRKVKESPQQGELFA